MPVENLDLEKVNQKNINIIEKLAHVAASSLGLEIWGIEIIGSALKPTVRVFVDKPFNGEAVAFVKPKTREEKSREKSIHPKLREQLEQLEKLEKIKQAEQAEVTELAENLELEGIDVENTYAENVGAENVGTENVGAENVGAENVGAENVGIDECTQISRLLGLAMEVEDVFDDTWVLEVSSPGLDRTFYKPAQMKAYVGHPIDVVLNISHPDFENRKKFKGTLLEVGEKVFSMDFEDNTYRIQWETVKRARLIAVLL